MYIGKHRNPQSSDVSHIHGRIPMRVKLHLDSSPALILTADAGSLMIHLDPSQVDEILAEAQRTFEAS